MMQLPPAIAKAFEDKATVTLAELCHLLPIDRKTLGRHIKAGNIAYVQLGMGDRAVRRAFTLAHVLRFLEKQERVEVPPEVNRTRRLGAAPGGFVALRAQMIQAELKARQRAQ